MIAKIDSLGDGLKPFPRAHGPPTVAFIIYDESSSPSADDYLIDADYPIETHL